MFFLYFLTCALAGFLMKSMLFLIKKPNFGHSYLRLRFGSHFLLPKPSRTSSGTAFCLHFGGIGSFLGGSWAVLGALGRLLGPSRAPLERSWALFGRIPGALGRVLGTFWISWIPLGGIFSIFDWFWMDLGRIFERFREFFGRIWKLRNNTKTHAHGQG